MLYGKDSPILKSRTKLSSHNQFEKLMSLTSLDKEAIMSEPDGSLVSDEDEGTINFTDVKMIYSIKPADEERATQDDGAGASEENLPEPVQKPRTCFIHLFDPQLLIEDGVKELDFMNLEMQCLDCLIKAPITGMYCHAADAHSTFLCIFCLATFQYGRQLEVHLLREHRVENSVLSNYAEFDNVYHANSVELACTDCNMAVRLTGTPEEDKMAVAKHECRKSACNGCGRAFFHKFMPLHYKTCQGGSATKVTPITPPVPLSMIKKEIEHVDLVSSNDVSPAKSISPPKPIESARLRNRDNRCKLCHEMVPPSKTAQHALECGGGSLSKSAAPVSPEKAANPQKRIVPRFQRPSIRRTLFNRQGSVTETNVNGSEIVVDPQNLTENMDCEGDNYFPPPNHDQDVHADPTSIADQEPALPDQDDTATSPPQLHNSMPSSEEAVPATTTTLPQITKEIPETSCDTNKDETSTEAKSSNKYQDPLLNEEDPEKRRSLLVVELCDFLERKHMEELRIDDNIDLRTRDVDIYSPVPEMTSDEILETMISNACMGCTYCRQAKIVGVDRRQLVIHLLTRHKWNLKFHDSYPQMKGESTGDDTTTEVTALSVNSTDHEQKSVLEIDWHQFKVYLLEKVFQLSNNVFNFPSRESFGKCPCECLLCGCHIKQQTELFSHWHKAHPQTSMKCYMCHENFLFVGALFSHLCFGTPQPLIKEEDLNGGVASLTNGGNEDGTPAPNYDDDSTDMLRYQCGLCEINQLPGFFNYIIHLRTDHFVCELCLQPLADQRDIQNHILKKHKLNSYCWKCKVAYSDLDTFSHHMFWKHGNASVDCNKCCDKKWWFVYHFCRPSKEFSCDICKEKFSKPMSLKVHKRIHTGEKLRKCPKHSCHEKFISKKLMEKHVDLVHNNSSNMISNEEADESQQPAEGEQALSLMPSEAGDDDETMKDEDAAADEGQIAESDMNCASNEAISRLVNNETNPDVTGDAEAPIDTADEVDAATTTANATQLQTWNGEYTGNETEESTTDGPEKPPLFFDSPIKPTSMDGIENNRVQLSTDVTMADVTEDTPAERMDAEEGEFTLSQQSDAKDSALPGEEDAGDDSDKPFDISDFKGPNLSEDEDESDGELSGENKRSKAFAAVSDEDIETTEKGPFNLDLNGHENYFDRINSPDMANYEHLLQENESDLETNDPTSADSPMDVTDVPDIIQNENIEKSNLENNSGTSNSESTTIQTNNSENIQTSSLDNTQTSNSEAIQTSDLDNAQNNSSEDNQTSNSESIQANDSESIIHNQSLSLYNIVRSKFTEFKHLSPEQLEELRKSIGQPTDTETTITMETDLSADSQSISTQKIQTDSSESSQTDCSKKIATNPVSTDLHQDLLLSDSDSSDDDGHDTTAANDKPATSSNDNTVLSEVNLDDPIVTESGVYDPNVKTGETAASSGDISTDPGIVYVKPEDLDNLESQYTMTANANSDYRELPDHIIYDNALRSIANDHDYCKIEPDIKVACPKEYGRMENLSPTCMADESSVVKQELQRSTAGSSHSSQIGGPTVIESSHSRKRARSSSSKSSSSSSSSSDSSSGSSSDSSGSDSEDDGDGQSEDETASPSNLQSSSSAYKNSIYSTVDNTYDYPSYAAHQTSTPLSSPAKRPRGRPKGSLNRDKFGVPTAKKFQMGRAAGSSKVARIVDDAYKPRRKYRKTKGKVGRPPKASATVEKVTDPNDETVISNTIPESDLETEDSGSEEAFHTKQLTERIRDKIPASDKLWEISNEEYLLRLLRGVENLEKLRLITEREAQAAITNKRRMKAQMLQEKQREYETRCSVTPASARQILHSFSNQETAFNLSPPSVPTPPVRQAKVKFGMGRGARGRGRGRGKGRQSVSTSRSNIKVTSLPAAPNSVPSLVINTAHLHASTKTISKAAAAAVEDDGSDMEIWCICQQPYGGREMVKCDFEKCPYKWYHLDCIGLPPQQVPEGDWYCNIDRCKEARRREKSAPVSGKRKRRNERLIGHYTH